MHERRDDGRTHAKNIDKPDGVRQMKDGKGRIEPASAEWLEQTGQRRTGRDPFLLTLDR